MLRLKSKVTTKTGLQGKVVGFGLVEDRVVYIVYLYNRLYDEVKDVTIETITVTENDLV